MNAAEIERQQTVDEYEHVIVAGKRKGVVADGLIGKRRMEPGREPEIVAAGHLIEAGESARIGAGRASGVKRKRVCRPRARSPRFRDRRHSSSSRNPDARLRRRTH